MSRIGFIGCGNMAEALIKGIMKARLYGSEDIIVSDVREEQRDYLVEKYDVASVETNKEAAANSGIVILAVKPQDMGKVLKDIKSSVGKGQLIISIAAGVRIGKIEKGLGDVAVVRVMPNTPALIGEGMSVLCANERGEERVDEATAIFKAVGDVVMLGNEGLLDVVTAVSGSGPAYFFLLAEQMMKTGVELGLSIDVANRLVLGTMKGAALLAIEREISGEDVAELRQKVTSKGGTTEAAMKVFGEGGFGGIVERAIVAAKQKGEELSK